MSIKSLIRGFSALVFLIAAMSTQAFAQNNVLVYDSNKVLVDSTVGKYMVTRLNSIGSTMQADIKNKKTTIDSEAKSLDSQMKAKAIDSREKLLADQELTHKVAANSMKIQGLQQYAAVHQKELQILQGKASREIVAKADEIATQIAKERGAQILLDKANGTPVIYVAPNVDITATVVSRLNSQMTSVAINRLPRNAPKQ